MRFLGKTLFVTLLSVAASAPSLAQGPQPATTVPRLVPVSGVFTPANGQPPAAVETVTLSIYAEESGGGPIWEEVQNVSIDPSGRYQILLGASLADGVPVDLFASGEARWLGIRFHRPGEVEAPRARLTSVPYAVHAASADTLGGRPASAYLLAPEAGGRDAGAAVASAISAAEVSPATITPGFANSVAKYLDNADTIGPSGLATSGNNLGIGTGPAVAVGASTPIDALNVRFTDTGGAITGISVRNNGNGAASYSGMLFYDQNGALAQFQGYNNLTREYRINNVGRVTPGGAFNGTINFMIGSTSRFFVATVGDVGIGTTNPVAPLHVVRSGTFANGLFTTYLDSAAGSIIDSRRARGTVSAPTPVLAVDTLLSLGGAGFNGTVFHRAATINVVAAGDFSVSSSPAFMRFSTTAPGTTQALERMRITEAGNVGIGDQSPATRLQVAGDVRVGTADTNGCLQQFDGNSIAGTCASDRRFKREITSFGSVLPAVAALRPVHYYWRATEFPERHFGDGQGYGLIAQEVEQVLPELVVADADGYKAVDYSKLPLLTVQAIKELKVENDALQSRSPSWNAW